MKTSLLSFLKTLKQFGIEKKIPNISFETGEFLNVLIKIHGSKNGLEIGCANGFSTIFLADAFRENKGKLTSIDFSLPALEWAKQNISETHLSHLVSFKFGHALKVLPKLKGKYDFVFIDAEKSLYKEFLQLVQKKLRKNAILCIDNVKKFPEKTKLFWEYMEKQKGFEYCTIPVSSDDAMMIMREK